MQYVKVLFTDRPIKIPTKLKTYTYRMPAYDTGIDLVLGDMVVVEAQDGYAIGQVAEFTDTINFNEKLLKNIIARFEVPND